MQFRLWHMFVVAFLVAYVLGIRSWASVVENEFIVVVGALVGAMITAISCRLFAIRFSIAIATGTLIAFAIGAIHCLECVFRSSATEYVHGHPIVGQYAADPQLATIVTLVYTFLGLIVSMVGAGLGSLIGKLTRLSGRATVSKSSEE